MKLFKRKLSARKLLIEEDSSRTQTEEEIPTRTPSTAMESFLMNLQQEHSITTIGIVSDGAPMLQRRALKGRDLDVSLAEQRWQSFSASEMQEMPNRPRDKILRTTVC